MKDFPLESIPQDYSVPQHLQRASSRTLGPASPSLVPVRTTHTNPQACWGRNLYNSQIQRMEHSWSLLKQTLSQQVAYRTYIAMESWSLCEKNKISLWWKTQENAFKNSRKSLLKNSPFDIEIKSKNLLKNFCEIQKKLSPKHFSKSCQKLSQKTQFIGSPKISHYRPDDLSFDRPTVNFLPFGAIGRPPSQPPLATERNALCRSRSVDRSVNQHPIESWVKPIGRPIGRPLPIYDRPVSRSRQGHGPYACFCVRR